MAPWFGEKKKLRKDEERFKEEEKLTNSCNKHGDQGQAKTIDEILEEDIGRHGWFQAYAGFFLNFALSTMGTGVYASIFTDYPAKFHCATDSIFNTTLAEGEEELFDQDIWLDESNRCPNETVCERYVYDKEVYLTSASGDFNIVCDDEYLRTLSGVLRMSGMLFGSFFFGWLSDYAGRLTALTLAGLTLMTSQALNIFSCNYLMFSILQLFQAGAGLATYITAFVMLFEWIAPVYRTRICVLAQVPFAVGFLYVVLMGYFVRTWKTLQLILAIPNALFFLYPLIFPESPRWLVTKGNMEKAKKSLNFAAKMNKGPLPENLVIKVGEIEQTDASKEENLTIIDFVRYKFLLSRVIIMSLNWLVITVCFYGLSLNSANNEDFFGSMAAMAAAEIPGYVAATIAMEVLGRRPVLSVFQIIAGISCITAGFIPMSMGDLRLSLAVIGKMGCSGGFAIVYVYTAELFPTKLRNSAMGVCSTVARIGGLFAPVIAGLDNIWEPLPFLIMGGISTIVGFLALLLPETRGTSLPQTLAEAKAIK